jgi:hypothetical protein
MFSSVKSALWRILAAILFLSAWQLPAQAMVVFHEEKFIASLRGSSGPNESKDIYYMLCSNGLAYLVHSEPGQHGWGGTQIDHSMIEAIVSRPLCRGQGGWLGQEDGSPVRIVDRPSRATAGSGPEGTQFDSLDSSCFTNEERSQFATFGDNIPVYRCSHRISERWLERWL